MGLTCFEVEDLFGIFDYTIKLNQEERVTIIHGPNGFGKTTLLRLVRGFFAKELEVFGSVPFKHFSMSFDDGRGVTIEKGTPSQESPDVPTCIISEVVDGAGIHSQRVPAMSQQLSAARQLERVAPYVRQLGEDRWEDNLDCEFLTFTHLLNSIPVPLVNLITPSRLQQTISSHHL